MLTLSPVSMPRVSSDANIQFGRLRRQPAIPAVLTRDDFQDKLEALLKLASDRGAFGFATKPAQDGTHIQFYQLNSQYHVTRSVGERDWLENYTFDTYGTLIEAATNPGGTLTGDDVEDTHRTRAYEVLTSIKPGWRGNIAIFFGGRN